MTFFIARPLAPLPPATGPSSSAGASADLGEEAPCLLLLYLSDRRRAGHASAASARTFTLCQGFAEEVTNLQKAGAAGEAMVAKLVQVGSGGWVGGWVGGWMAALALVQPNSKWALLLFYAGHHTAWACF